MRAQLRALAVIHGALKERAHDAGFNELPVGFAGVGQLFQFIFGDFKNGRILEKMPVEMADFVFAESATPGHDFEKCFERFGEVAQIVEAGLEQFSEKFFRQQSGVLGKETKDDAVEKAGDAKVFLLRDRNFGAALGVGQFDAFAALQ
ncbi:MAG: hypothetical protein ABSH38_22525 [Verrucomicrobiota bacterium]